MILEIKNELPNLECWNRFIHSHPDANIFHSPEMFDVFSHSQGHVPHIWYAINDRSEIVALFPFVDVFIDNNLSKYTGRSISYGGFLHQNSKEGKNGLSQILKFIGKTKHSPTVFTEVRNCAQTDNAKDYFLQTGFIFEDYLNYIIKLDRPIDKILENVGKSTRKKILKQKRLNSISFEMIQHIEEIDDCYTILQKTYQYKHVPLADISLFKSAFEILHPKNRIRAILAKHEGQNVATFIDLMFNDKIYGWYGGFDREYKNIDVNENIYWDLIEWGALNNYKLLDLGGAGRPNEKYGVRNFKSKFGGELVNWGRYTHIHHPILYRLGKIGYRFYNRKFFHE